MDVTKVQDVGAVPLPKVFVSHSHLDYSFTARLVEDLRMMNGEVWVDDSELGVGNFQERISKALASCNWFVLVLTQNALASSWVRQEVDAANRLKHQGQIRDLVFVQGGPLEHQNLPPLWGVYNIIDATADYTSALNRVCTAIGLHEKRQPDFVIRPRTS